MHDSLSQMHPYGNRPDREVLQILNVINLKAEDIYS